MKLTDFFWIDANCIFTGRKRRYVKKTGRMHYAATDNEEFEIVYYANHKRITNWYALFQFDMDVVTDLEGSRAAIKYNRFRPYRFKFVEWIEEE